MTDIINKLRHRCFFDVTIGDTNVGRIIFELFNDICPKTCDNFRSLCTGEKGIGKTTGKPLHYKNVIFHRVIKNFIIQSGDFSSGNGRGGESIYGGTFPDENFDIKHEKPFLLSMANRGKNTNGSQFFITLNPAPHLDGVHVVFGHVLSGEEVIKEIENQSADKSGKPLTDVVISNCGELIPQIKTKDKKKKHKKEKSRKSDGEVTSDEENKESRKDKKKKHKKHKKKKEENKDNEVKLSEKEIEDMNIECSVKPEEVPDIPENKFLMREEDRKEENNGQRNFNRMSGDRRDVSRSGRKFKGRGIKRYRTPSPEHRYRSGSETPPHWKSEQRKTLNWKDVVSGKRSRDNGDRDSFRYYDRRSDFRRRDYRTRNQSYSNSVNANQRDNSERKRVFREEAPNRTHVRPSVSPQRSSDQDKEDRKNNGISFVSQTEESPEIQRHSVRSAVKLKEKKESPKDVYGKESEDTHLDLTDIPLPDSRDDQNSSDQTVDRKEKTLEVSNNRRQDSNVWDAKRGSHRRRHSTDS